MDPARQRASEAPPRDSLSASDLIGKRALVTGANSGIGLATARALARRGATVWLACRSVEVAQAAVAEIAPIPGRVQALAVDLADLDSVRSGAASFLETGEGLDILINNAGIAWRRGGTTAQGFELFFGVNYLGPFLLTRLLLPTLLASPAARIVNVSSLAHYAVKEVDWDALRRPTVHRLGRPEYCFSKLCNVLHAKELARQYAGTTLAAFALHPGVVASGVWRGMPRLEKWWKLFGWFMRGKLISHREGAQNTLECALDALPEGSGLYYDAGAPKEPSALALDPELARKLWERSEDWIAGHTKAF